MPLARLREPFDHPDWIFELKLDGFRAWSTVAPANSDLPLRADSRPRSCSQRLSRPFQPRYAAERPFIWKSLRCATNPASSSARLS